MRNLKRIPVGSTVDGWPSDTWDTICTAVEQWPTRLGGGDVPFSRPQAQQPAIVAWCKNKSGSDLAKGHVLGIDSIIADFTISANKIQIFDDVPTIKGVAPTAEDHSLSLAVLLQGIDDDGEGWVAIGGLAWALVDVTDSGHTHAKIDDGETLLISGTSGAKIIVKESGTGTKKALINLATYVPPSSIRFGRTTSTISAASGTTTRTLGSGTVDLFTNSGTSGTNTTNEVTAYNCMASAIATDTYVQLAQFSPSSDWFITAVDCGA